ncbi:MAG: leucine-rich repeat domain-containing protein [Candidatus Anstonellales archaeon]
MLNIFNNKKNIFIFLGFIIFISFALILIFNFNKFFINKKTNNTFNYIQERVERDINNLGDLSNVKYLFVKSSSESTSTKTNLLPADFFKNTQLEILALNNLGYNELPAEIGNLINLRYLYLNDNKLKTLPDSLEKLSKLEFLNISGNDFEKIPEVVYKLKNLKTLIAVNNKNLSKEEQQKLIQAFSEGVVLADINYEKFRQNNSITTSTSNQNLENKKQIDFSRLKPNIPYGSQTFQVYQNENVLPKIWEVKIDPPDVRVGDKQKLSIIVESPYNIKSVRAVTKLDNSTKTIDLVYIKDVSNNELQDRKFSVSNNELIENNFFVKLWDKLITKAFSQESIKKLYEAEWIVSDTHDEIYYTTFYVEDVKNNKNSVTIAWSDACGIPNGGNWTISYNCTISSPDGVDNGNVTIQTYTLTLNSIFVFNPTKTITINSGSIVVGSSGQIQKAYIYLKDADNDNYIPESSYTQYTNSSASWSSPYKRRYLFSSIYYSDCDDYNSSINAPLAYYYDNDADGYGGTFYGSYCSSPGPQYVTLSGDCYDYNSNARPNQSNYFTSNRGDGSFDYDCDGSVINNGGSFRYTCYFDGSNCLFYSSPAASISGVLYSVYCSGPCTGTNCVVSCQSGSIPSGYCGSLLPYSNGPSGSCSNYGSPPQGCNIPSYYASYSVLLGCK